MLCYLFWGPGHRWAASERQLLFQKVGLAGPLLASSCFHRQWERQGLVLSFLGRGWAGLGGGLVSPAERGISPCLITRRPAWIPGRSVGSLTLESHLLGHLALRVCFCHPWVCFYPPHLRNNPLETVVVCLGSPPLGLAASGQLA